MGRPRHSCEKPPSPYIEFTTTTSSTTTTIAPYESLIEYPNDPSCTTYAQPSRLPYYTSSENSDAIDVSPCQHTIVSSEDSEYMGVIVKVVSCSNETKNILIPQDATSNLCLSSQHSITFVSGKGESYAYSTTPCGCDGFDNIVGPPPTTLVPPTTLDPPPPTTLDPPPPTTLNPPPPITEPPTTAPPPTTTDPPSTCNWDGSGPVQVASCDIAESYQWEESEDGNSWSLTIQLCENETLSLSLTCNPAYVIPEDPGPNVDTCANKWTGSVTASCGGVVVGENDGNCTNDTPPFIPFTLSFFVGGPTCPEIPCCPCPLDTGSCCCYDTVENAEGEWEWLGPYQECGEVSEGPGCPTCSCPSTPTDADGEEIAPSEQHSGGNSLCIDCIIDSNLGGKVSLNSASGMGGKSNPLP